MPALRLQRTALRQASVADAAHGGALTLTMPFTVETRIRLFNRSTGFGSAAIMALMSKSNASHITFRVYMQSGNLWGEYSPDGGTTGRKRHVMSPDPTIDGWETWSVRYTLAASDWEDKIVIFRNGVRVPPDSHFGSGTDGLWDGTAPLRIGGYHAGTDTLDGWQAETRVWNFGRSNAEIAEWHDKPLDAAQAALAAAYWPGDGILVEDVEHLRDASPHGNHAVLQSGAYVDTSEHPFPVDDDAPEAPPPSPQPMAIGVGGIGLV